MLYLPKQKIYLLGLVNYTVVVYKEVKWKKQTEERFPNTCLPPPSFTIQTTICTLLIAIKISNKSDTCTSSFTSKPIELKLDIRRPFGVQKQHLSQFHTRIEEYVQNIPLLF